MKNNKVICSLALCSFLFSSTAFAAKCNESMGGMEKEMLELTYMSKEELAGEYCRATYLGDVLISSATKFMELGAIDRGMQVMGEGSACSSYATKVLRVAKKDHDVESFECEEGSPVEKDAS
tara:strand:- start:495 stop:860 length:366 start_codon:yes stop_codon:yes gene_type:complete